MSEHRNDEVEATTVVDGPHLELLERVKLVETDPEVESAVSRLLVEMNEKLGRVGTPQPDENFSEELAKTLGYTALKSEIAAAKSSHDSASAVAKQVRQLSQAMATLGRGVYTSVSVNAYTAACLKPFQDRISSLLPRRDFLRLRQGVWGWTTITDLILSITASFRGGQAGWPWWTFVGIWLAWIALLVTYIVVQTKQEAVQAEIDKNWRQWYAVPIGAYPNPIPGDVLRLALVIGKRVEGVKIEVVQFCNAALKAQLVRAVEQKEAEQRRERWLAWWNSLTPEERRRHTDPLLRVTVGVGHKLQRQYYVAAWNEPNFHPVDTTVAAES